MALANDNFVGYVPKFIVEQRVRWIEAAAACPVFTNMIVYYVEGHHGHVMKDEVGQQTARHAARGNVFTFQMPWEDIHMQVNDLVRDDELLMRPHSPNVLAHLVKIELRNGSGEMLKHLKDVRLRSHVVLGLGLLLIDRHHEDVVGTSSGIVGTQRLRAMKAKYTSDVAELYPATVYDTFGAVPDAIIDALKSQWKKGKEPKTFVEQSESVIQDKHATPAEGVRTLENVWDDVRPHAVVDERIGSDLADPVDLVVNALNAEPTLKIQTGGKFQEAMVPQFLSRAFPWALPYMVGGPEFPEKKMLREQAVADRQGVVRWRRAPCAPVVSTADYVSGMARRVETQIAADWHFLPAVWNLHIRHAALSTPLSLIRVSTSCGMPHDVRAEKLRHAARGIFQQLESNAYVFRGQTRKLDGDVMKLMYDDNLSAEQRDLLQSYRAMTNRLPGTQEIRYSIGHNMFGYRITAGEGLFITISPNERHSTLVLRMSRARQNDPALHSVDLVSAARKRFSGSNAPSLFLDDDEAHLELPSFETRRAISARDPLSTVYAFQVQVRVLLAMLLGVRMCPNCPHCATSKFPCANKFGHNTFPMGGVFGAVDGLGVQLSTSGLELHIFMGLLLSSHHINTEH